LVWVLLQSNARGGDDSKRERIDIYWPHVLGVPSFFLHIQEWWVTYELKTFKPWADARIPFHHAYPIALSYWPN